MIMIVFVLVSSLPGKLYIIIALGTLKKLQKEWRKLGPDPTEYQREMMGRQMEELATAASAYLDKKTGNRSEDDLNELEKSRVAAVKAVKDFADRQISSLGILKARIERKENPLEKAAFRQAYGPMGKLIADGLKMNNDLFASSQKLNGNAAILGEVGGTLLGILEGRPELMAAAKEGGLTEQDLQNARGAAAMAQVYRNGLEAQKEIHQAVLEDRGIDRPEARAATVFWMEMANRSVAHNYTRHEKTIESSRDEVQIKQILVDKELYDLRAANAAPEMIAQKEAENVRLRLESAAFAYRGFPASDMQKQLGAVKEGVTDLQTRIEKLPDVRKLAQARPMEIGKIMRSGGIGKILNSAAPQKQAEPAKRPTEPELQKTAPQKTGP